MIGSNEDSGKTKSDKHMKNRRISYRRADSPEEEKIYGITLLPFTEHGFYYFQNIYFFT